MHSKKNCFVNYLFPQTVGGEPPKVTICIDLPTLLGEFSITSISGHVAYTITMMLTYFYLYVQGVAKKTTPCRNYCNSVFALKSQATISLDL